MDDHDDQLSDETSCVGQSVCPVVPQNVHVSQKLTFTGHFTSFTDGAGGTFPTERCGQPAGVAARPAESPVTRCSPPCGEGRRQHVWQSPEWLAGRRPQTWGSEEAGERHLRFNPVRFLRFHLYFGWISWQVIVSLNKHGENCFLYPERGAVIPPGGGSRSVFAWGTVCVDCTKDGHAALVTNVSRPGESRLTTGNAPWCWAKVTFSWPPPPPGEEPPCAAAHPAAAPVVVSAFRKKYGTASDFSGTQEAFLLHESRLASNACIHCGCVSQALSCADSLLSQQRAEPELLLAALEFLASLGKIFIPPESQVVEPALSPYCIFLTLSQLLWTFLILQVWCFM